MLVRILRSGDQRYAACSLKNVKMKKSIKVTTLCKIASNDLYVSAFLTSSSCI